MPAETDPEHPQVRLHAGGQTALVDEELVPLLRETWLADIETNTSCQDAGESLAWVVSQRPEMADFAAAQMGRSYIEIWTLEDVQRFLELIARGKPPAPMSERMDQWIVPEHWQVEAMTGREEGEEFEFDTFAFRVFFPRSDIDEMTACLRRGREGEG